jgi:Uma2 family endonuclease
MENETLNLPSAGPVAPEYLPNIDDLIIEDGQPVESIFAEKLHRLLTEALYASWPGPGGKRTFLVTANVGLFYEPKAPPLVPDVMLSIDVPANRDLTRKEHRSYLKWEIGKPPDVAIELVSASFSAVQKTASGRTGGEDSHKLRDYAKAGVPFSVIFDPRGWLGAGVARGFSLKDGAYSLMKELRFETVGLGLTPWEGVYEGHQDCWLRWCDLQGNLIPTGRERIEQEREEARRQADQARQQADQARQQAELAAQQLTAAQEQIRELTEKLRAAGGEPPG